MEIRTNNASRALVYGWELRDKERKEFDYFNKEDLDSHRFFRFKTQVYALGEFVRISTVARVASNDWSHRVEPDSPLAAWDGIKTESAFSAVVVKYCPMDEDRVVIGQVFS